MVINIGFLYNTRTNSLFLCYTQFAQEYADHITGKVSKESYSRYKLLLPAQI